PSAQRPVVNLFPRLGLQRWGFFPATQTPHANYSATYAHSPVYQPEKFQSGPVNTCPNPLKSKKGTGVYCS
ncbi:MAG TPA: hypothetical protein VK014_13070, partial [Cyclobacteriaceae bacterium]|nr:hypothetical protein [Cyclobacteriaceae bacterium]